MSESHSSAGGAGSFRFEGGKDKSGQLILSRAAQSDFTGEVGEAIVDDVFGEVAVFFHDSFFE